MQTPQLRRWAAAALTVVAFGAASTAQAALTLTTDGINLGFNLATVIQGVTPNCCNILGSAVNSDGKIVVNQAGLGVNGLFNNVNNQVWADNLSTSPNPGFPTAMANAGGTLYASGSYLRKLNNDGSTNATYNNIYMNAGMWTNPVNQHLIGVGSADGVGSGLLDIDVSGATPTARLINGASSDGVTVSPDGTIVYTNSGAYRISDGSSLGSFFVSGADGMGVISSSNDLNGDVVVSTTDGRLVLLDVDNNYAQTLIATGGGYGDFTSPDFTSGTLLISSGDSLLRLGCGQGCGVGSVNPNSVPEPQTIALMGVALLGLARTSRRKLNA